MLENEMLLKIRHFALENSENNDIHGFSHVERVYNTCVKIGQKLNANMKVLKIAALLHDIGRIDEKADNLKRNHAEISAIKAKEHLTINNYNLSEKELDDIIHSIKVHSFSNSISPLTLEAKILSDADKLDAIGAIGIYRTIGFTLQNHGGMDQIIEHLENKILKLKDQMNLDYSKKLAKNRHKIVLNFYKKLKKEKA
ncbi:MAG: HD domain-containing protein [Promethearchaeota archaeon]|nr:MAG: HD domain-containing protein [Candidatus Lokiarchaeota archaeon]